MKTEPRQGFPICPKCKNGEMVLFGQLLSLPPINIFKCDMCGYKQQEKRLKTEKCNFCEKDIEGYTVVLRVTPKTSLHLECCSHFILNERLLKVPFSGFLQCLESAINANHIDGIKALVSALLVCNEDLL